MIFLFRLILFILEKQFLKKNIKIKHKNRHFNPKFTKKSNKKT
ncbi:hypothetical protein BafACA1_0195 [Borreliella afzelii ACA-1]|nr:hypothetical protein BafACA1_0195 [Borreliella afzelii ACA-1]